MADNRPDSDSVAAQVKALRKALGWTQETLAERAGDGWQRLHITMLEGGRNNASSWSHRVGLSRAFGLDVWDLDAYLAGSMSLAEALRRHRSNVGAETGPTIVRDDRYPSRGEVLEAVRGLLDAEAIERVSHDALLSADDPGHVYWLEEVIREHKRALLRRSAPEIEQAERERGERAFREYAAKDAAAAAARRDSFKEAVEKKRRGE